MTVTDKKKRRCRWISFRLSTLFLAVTVVAMALGFPHIHRHIQFQRFKTFADQDIRALPESSREKFEAIVNDLLPNIPSFAFDRPENWFVWRLPTDSGKRFVLLQGVNSSAIPGRSRADVYFFDDWGRLVGQSRCFTGDRINIVDAAIVTNIIDGESLIRVNSAPYIGGGDITTQYYAILDGELVLLRLEDSSGACIPNDYAAPNFTIGPATVTRTDTEWIRALEDPRATEVLRTLVWIGGRHGRPIREPVNFAHEDFNQATLHLKVRHHPDTKPALVALASSTNTWISEAAQVALRSLEGHRGNRFK